MKITVKNFGPIREAIDIEISPMTLFVGPSNTGKSYLAVLIYSIFKVLNTDTTHKGFSSGRDGVDMPALRISKANEAGRLAQLDGAILKEYKRYNNTLSKFFTSIKKDSTSIEMQKIAESLTKSVFFIWANVMKKTLEYQILYCFGESGSNLLENKKMSVMLSPNNNEILVDIMSPSESKISNEIKEKISRKLIERIQQEIKKTKKNERPYVTDPNDFCIEEFTALLRGENFDIKNCHYLPAIRGGIMQSHRGLVNTVVKRAPMAGLGKISSPSMFTGVLADFMVKLFDIPEKEAPMLLDITFRSNEEKISKKKMDIIGKTMETDIMQGEIEVRMTRMRYPDFHYKFEHNNEPHDLSLMNASSMVSELAPVSLFIRHHLEKGDFFIVEEPEAHLHPAGQRKIADVLVQLTNAGIFVLATTHSDIILEQISNSILASKLKPAKLKALSKHPTPLKENNSTSYSFAKRVKESTVVKKILFDSMTGVITQDHLDVSSDIYNESVSLLEGQEDD